jgi:hypothetical protein
LETPFLRTVHGILTNPVYGCAYAHGKTEQMLHYEYSEARRGTRRKPWEQWLALISHSHQGYVSWEEFERMQQVMAENVRGRAQASTVQRDPALLAGLLRCRHCP